MAKKSTEAEDLRRILVIQGEALEKAVATNRILAAHCVRLVRAKEILLELLGRQVLEPGG